MKQSDNSFSEAKASEILELAARYYTEENQTYTVKELIHAGTEAQIPDYLVIKAIQDLKTQKQQKLARKKRIQHRLTRVLGYSLFIVTAIAVLMSVPFMCLLKRVKNDRSS